MLALIPSLPWKHWHKYIIVHKLEVRQTQMWTDDARRYYQTEGKDSLQRQSLGNIKVMQEADHEPKWHGYHVAHPLSAGAAGKVNTL